MALSLAERQRIEQLAWDPRIADALERGLRYGLAQYVAAGPRLWQRWLSAHAVDNPLPSRVGAALVAAAIDCRRAGLVRPVPEQVLRDLLPGYLRDGPDAGQLAPTVIADGLAWATTQVQATTALLTPEEGGYVVFDYLVDQVQLSPDAAPVPDVVLERLLVDPAPEDAFGIGVAGYETGQRPIAERAFRAAAEAGDHDAESNLGVLLRQLGRLDEAEQWYRQAASAGHRSAAYNLGVLLEDVGRIEDAEYWYRWAADAGQRSAAYNLGILLEELGQVDQAERWYRQAADTGHHDAENNLGVLLRQQGRLDEAEQWYRQAADAGHHDAQYNLGVLLEDLGRVEEAEQWSRRAADAGMRDQVEWAPDAPSDRDLLRRRPLARVIATQLRRLHTKEPGTSFLIHIDGPWGAGKSTIMRFLREELRDGWVIVNFDAWREARIGPPWWALLAALRYSITRDLPTRARARLRVAEVTARLRRVGAPFTLALALLLGLATGAFLLLQPRTLTFTTAGDIARTTTAIITALGALWAGAFVAGRLLLWDSPRGARLFEQSNTNPMQDVAEHFGWLVAKARKPVIVFIDDLDRCEEAHVVALLDTIQTLVRDAPKRRPPPRNAPPATIYVVVAADGAWLRASYEATYERFTAPIAEPGRPLGHLFLDKLFQLRVPVPIIDAARHDGYLRSLLGTASEVAHDLAEEQDVLGKVRRSTTEGEVIEALRQATPTVRGAVAAAAAARLSAPRLIAATEHSLQRFIALLPPNPRSTKRFLNSYSILRAVRTLEANPVPSEPLALWTILETRWPSLADYLRHNPEAVEMLHKQATALDLEPIPVEIRDLFTDPTIQRLADFEYGGPLTADLIRACCGAAIFEPGEQD